MADRGSRLLLALIAALAAGAAACGAGDEEAPAARRLARETFRATRLQAHRQLLAPRRLVRHPGELTWTLQGAQQQVAPAHGLRLAGEGPCSASAELPITEGVAYTIRARLVGEAPQLRFATTASASAASADEPSWEAPLATRAGAESYVVGTTARHGRRLLLRVDGRGPTTLSQLEVRESPAHTTQQLLSGADVHLRGVVVRPSGAGVSAAREALLASGATDYAWPLGPARGERVLELATALVPRHGAAAKALRMGVEGRVAGRWREVFAVTRGGAGDRGGWRPARVTLGRATAVRLRTRPVAAGASVTVAWGTPTVVAAPPAAHPDVFIVSVDALRPDRLSAFGHRGGLTSTIDALAAKGTLFTEARAARGETWESTFAIAAAQRPELIGVPGRGYLPRRGLRTIVDAFAEAGYLTARIGDFLLPPGQMGAFDLEVETGIDVRTAQRVRRLLRAPRHRPRFVWLHLAATHYPYNPDPAFLPAGMAGGIDRGELNRILSRPLSPEDQGRLLALYEACIRQTDALLRRLLPQLTARRAKGPAPLVALISDHGAHLGEQKLWFLHSTLYRASLHVPWILHSPGRVPAGRRVDRLVRLIDLGPTLLDYAGLEPTGFGGRSVRPLVEGRAASPRVNIVQEPLLGFLAVETDRFKMIANPRRLAGTWPEMGGLSLPIPRVSLFAWREDPGETRNIAAREPLLVGELWRLATEPERVLERQLTPAAARLLEQAGYARPGQPARR